MSEHDTFQKILVGANGTPESDHAMQVALSLAKSLRAQITILGVIVPLSAETQAEGVGLEEALNARNQLEEQINTAASSGRDLGIDVHTETVEGDPEKEIEEKADRDSIDLIVVGHRDIARVRRWLEGSTSEALVRNSKICVLVVRDDQN